MYGVNICENTSGGKRHTRAPKGSSPKSPAEVAAGKLYAKEHGVLRGGVSKADGVPTGAQPVLNLEAEDEGLLVFVQSTSCCRRVWAIAFENNPQDLQQRPSGVLCCDICDASLFDRTRPGPPIRNSKISAPQKGDLDLDAKQKLEFWRRDVLQRNNPSSMLPSSAILDDTTIRLIACTGHISLEKFKQFMKHQWIWWDIYGEELATYRESLFQHLEPPPEKAQKPKRVQKQKVAGYMDEGSSVGGAGPSTGLLHFESLKVLAPGPLDNQPYEHAVMFEHYSQQPASDSRRGHKRKLMASLT